MSTRRQTKKTGEAPLRAQRPSEGRPAVSRQSKLGAPPLSLPRRVSLPPSCIDAHQRSTYAPLPLAPVRSLPDQRKTNTQPAPGAHSRVHAPEHTAGRGGRRQPAKSPPPSLSPQRHCPHHAQARRGRASCLPGCSAKSSLGGGGRKGPLAARWRAHGTTARETHGHPSRGVPGPNHLKAAVYGDSQAGVQGIPRRPSPQRQSSGPKTGAGSAPRPRRRVWVGREAKAARTHTPRASGAGAAGTSPPHGCPEKRQTGGNRHHTTTTSTTTTASAPLGPATIVRAGHTRASITTSEPRAATAPGNVCPRRPEVGPSGRGKNGRPASRQTARREEGPSGETW